jgi:hypothetical protein
MENKVKLEYQDLNNWNITNLNFGKSTDGFKLLRRGNKFYVQSPSQSVKNEAYQVDTLDLIEVIYNYFIRPEKVDKTLLNPHNLVNALNVNDTAFRQLYLNKYWQLKK